MRGWWRRGRGSVPFSVPFSVWTASGSVSDDGERTQRRVAATVSELRGSVRRQWQRPAPVPDNGPGQRLTAPVNGQPSRSRPLNFIPGLRERIEIV
jgi:hypothetical protein